MGRRPTLTPPEGVWGLGCSPGTTARTAGRGVWERRGQAGPGRPGTQAERARQGEEAGSWPYTCSSGTRPADLPCPAPPQPPPEPTGSGRSWAPCQSALLRWGSNRPLCGHQDEEGPRSVKGEDGRPGLWKSDCVRRALASCRPGFGQSVGPSCLVPLVPTG